MDLVFYKLHCLTEDYILINTGNNPHISRERYPSIAAAICKRRTGPGASGVIFFIGTDPVPSCRLYNPAGEEIHSRSSALFCLSRYIFDSGFVGTDSFVISLSGREVPVDIIDSSNFRISGGTPVNPGTGNPLVPNPRADYTVPVIVGGKQLMVSPVRIQETFLIHISDSLNRSLIRSLTAEIESAAEEQGIQPVFLFIKNRDECRVGFTAHGNRHFDFTEACAAAGTAGVMNGLLERELVIECRRETVFLQWLEKDNILYVTAAPKYVYTGNFEINGDY